jgi:hypothetical protein
LPDENLTKRCLLENRGGSWHHRPLSESMGSAASRQRDAEQNEKGSSANTNRRRSCVPDPVTVTETPREGCNDAAARMDMIKRQIEQGLHERRPGQDEEERREREESVRTMVSEKRAHQKRQGNTSRGREGVSNHEGTPHVPLGVRRVRAGAGRGICSVLMPGCVGAFWQYRKAGALLCNIS